MTKEARTDVLVALKPLPSARARLRFTLLASGATKEFVLHDVPRRMEAMKRALPALLTRFRVAISPEETVHLNARHEDAALRRLHSLAYGLLDLLLECEDGATRQVGETPSPIDFVAELSRFLAPVIAIAHKRRRGPPVIELSAEDLEPLAWYLPLELFPIDLRAESLRLALSKLETTHEKFLGFLGMQAIVVRRRRADPKVERSHTGRTPLAVVAYRGSDPLPGIESQLAFFARRKSSFEFDTDTVWPRDDEVDEDDAVDELARHISRTQAARLNGSPRPVLHFCCHYLTGDTGPEIGITDDVSIGITDLRGTLASPLVGVPKSTHVGRPLVFVNACRSGSLSRGDESLLRLLLHRGYCHVLVGETLLPDRVAGEFAKQVYAGALRGQPVGMAVWRARRYLLEKFNNPGGLLYTLYGSPDIRLD
ncbi:MAG: CHAT domain-containing protein [Acidovorax sp.]